MYFDQAVGTVSENLIVGNQASINGGAISILVRRPNAGLAVDNRDIDWNVINNEFRRNVGGVIEFAPPRYGGNQSIRVAGCNLAENSGPVFVNRTTTTVRLQTTGGGRKARQKSTSRLRTFSTTSGSVK